MLLSPVNAPSIEQNNSTRFLARETRLLIHNTIPGGVSRNIPTRQLSRWNALRLANCFVNVDQPISREQPFY